MKVLVLTSQTSDSGAWVRARGISLGLREAGCQVWSPRPPGTWPLFLHFVLPLPFYLCWALLRRYDWILVLKPYPHAMIPALTAKWLRGAKILCDVDDVDWEYRSGFLSEVLRRLQKPWPSKAGLVSYHHPDLRGRILKEFGVAEENLIVLPQGVFGGGSPMGTGTALPPSPLPSPTRGEGSTKIVGYLAHFNQASEEESILDIFDEATKGMEGVQLCFIGGGPGLAELRRKARVHFPSPSPLPQGERVRFTGPLRPEEVQGHLARCAALLHYTPDKPANRYRCSMKLRDYLASGLPVAANALFEAALFKDVIYSSPGDDPQGLGAVLRGILEGRTDGREAGGPARVRDLDWRILGKDLKKTLEVK